MSPFGLIPPDILHDFLAKDPAAIQSAKEWIDRNGRIILFTKNKIRGDEDIWVTDTGEIILGTANYSSIEIIRQLVWVRDRNLYQEIFDLGTDEKAILDRLKTSTPLF